MDEEHLLDLMDMERESQGLPSRTPLEVTPELDAVAEEYTADLQRELERFAVSELGYSPQNAEDFAGMLIDDEHAPMLVVLTLSGSGVSIEDGRWDEWFSLRQLKKLSAQLERALSRYVDDTGGGRLSDAVRDAVDQAATDAIEQGRYWKRNRSRRNRDQPPRANPQYGPMHDWPGGPRSDERTALQRELLQARTPAEREEVRRLLAELDREEAEARYYARVPNPSRRSRIVRSAPVEYLPGGYAAGMGDEEFDPEQLAMGIEVELEHIDPNHPEAEAIAAEIARDHLREHPRYYDALIAAGL